MSKIHAKKEQKAKRFYCQRQLVRGQEVNLDDDLAHYVRNVLRIKSGEHIHIFNESQGEFEAVVTTVSKRSVIIQVSEPVKSITESPLNIHLGQAISRGERMDFVVQKAVELGVTTITPLFTERCNVKLSEERAENRVHHWQHVAISACEQSGRSHVPKINMPENFANWVENRNEGLRLICHPEVKNGSCDEQNINDVALLIGPEGGFSDDEVEYANKNDFNSLNLGPRILRTETATIVALTLLQQCWGDICKQYLKKK